MSGLQDSPDANENAPSSQQTDLDTRSVQTTRSRVSKHAKSVAGQSSRRAADPSAAADLNADKADGAPGNDESSAESAMLEAVTAAVAAAQASLRVLSWLGCLRLHSTRDARAHTEIEPELHC